jgi:hypothetical protein
LAGVWREEARREEEKEQKNKNIPIRHEERIS